MDVKSVVIIGAGSAGLAAAKYLLAEKKFDRIDIYEQRSTTGGVWNTSSHVSQEPGFSVPRTSPSLAHEYAVVVGGDNNAHVELVSPVYDNLETNIPHGLMSYTDLEFPAGTALFPKHQAVLAYIQQYGREVEHLVTFETQVQGVRKVLAEEDGKPTAWEVGVKDLKTGAVSTRRYDAVVAASGHYSDPFVPDVTGVAEFEAAHPGSIVHSKFYRRPEQFTGKACSSHADTETHTNSSRLCPTPKVLVVGNSASGIDISHQIATAARLPVLISEKDSHLAPGASLPPPTTWSRHVGQVAALLPATRSVRFTSGHVEADVDAVVFCTGYHYSFPFLSRTLGIEAQDGSHADHLWQHVLYSRDPTLALLVIPKRIVPFPFAEAQAAVVARMWAGRLPVPGEAEMDAWVARRVAESPPGARHTMSFPQDAEYINGLHALSQQARLDSERGLENGGRGKEPPYWGEETSWVRSKIFQIKVASRELGDRRKECKTLVDLGFDFHAETRGAKE